MNWIRDFVRPKIGGLLGKKREVPDDMWVKCPETGEMVFYRDLEANQYVIPGSGHHMRMKPKQRLEAMFDDKEWQEIELPDVKADPLKFKDQKKYTDRIKTARQRTGRKDAIVAASGTLNGLPVVIAVQDFEFMGGSLGMAAGEAIITSMREAVKQKAPCILFVSSGGARMQEGILSLMQLPRTTVAVQELRAANLPYIVVLTNPTTGGVTASYAMLGDVHIAEPGALVCFAGPRVIEQTIREKLPAGFQRAEYLLEHGMIDMVVHRHDLRQVISNIISVLTKTPVIPVKKDAPAGENDDEKAGTDDEAAGEAMPDTETDKAGATGSPSTDDGEVTEKAD